MYFGDEVTHDMSNVNISHPSDAMDVTEGAWSNPDQNYLIPPPSPPPEAYMPLAPKRSKKREHPSSSHAHAPTTTATMDLARREVSRERDMAAEIKHLRMELESAKKQNDILNRKLMMMGEGAQVISQLQQFMSHLQILPEPTTQALSTTKGTTPMPTSQLKQFAPFAAFRDACNRYRDLPIVLFDLTSSANPEVALANDAFNALFQISDSMRRPWIHFISPLYLQRTATLLKKASLQYLAVKFVQVYQTNQTQFVALDVHHFFHVHLPHSRQALMDLVFIIRLPQDMIPMPSTTDFMVWPVSLDENGQITDLPSLTNFGSLWDGSNSRGASSSMSHVTSGLSSSTGIAMIPDASDFEDTSFGISGAGPGRGPTINELVSPSVVEVSTPPQDNLRMDVGVDRMLSASPLDPSPVTWTEQDWNDPNAAWKDSPAWGYTDTSAGNMNVEDVSSPTKLLSSGMPSAPPHSNWPLMNSIGMMPPQVPGSGSTDDYNFLASSGAFPNDVASPFDPTLDNYTVDPFQELTPVTSTTSPTPAMDPHSRHRH